MALIISEQSKYYKKNYTQLDDAPVKKIILKGIEMIQIKDEEKKKERKVPIGKPMRSSGPKKYKVYVRNPKTGNIKQINFGDVKGGLSAKVSDPKARSSFAKRHRCHLKKDRMTPGYWACRSNRYANLWGGKTYGGYW